MRRFRELHRSRRFPPGLNCACFNATSAAELVMPTYEYHCAKCDQNFEMVQSMRDEPVHQCPKELCRLPKWGHGKVKRLLGTGAGIIFKGSGFYQTDYRSDSYKEAVKKESPPQTAPAKSSDSDGSEKKSSPAKNESSNKPKTKSAK